MKKTFNAQKMIDRCRKEGKSDLLTPDMIAYIRSLDGQIGDTYNFESVVHGENMVWLYEKGVYVNAVDCE